MVLLPHGSRRRYYLGDYVMRMLTYPWVIYEFTVQRAEGASKRRVLCGGRRLLGAGGLLKNLFYLSPLSVSLSASWLT